MTPTEIAKLDPFEGYPTWYDRQNITMEAYMTGAEGSIEKVKSQIDGQAYI